MAEEEPSSQTALTVAKRRRRWLFWGAGISLALTVAAAGLVLWIKHNTGLYGSARRAWKDRAIAEVGRTVGDKKKLVSAIWTSGGGGLHRLFRTALPIRNLTNVGQETLGPLQNQLPLQHALA